MAGDRALFAAFQKVRGDLEGALEQTRKKEEAARAREEAERLRMRREGFSKQAAAKGASALVRGPAMQEKGKKSAAAAKSAAQAQPQPAAAEPKRLSKAAAAGGLRFASRGRREFGGAPCSVRPRRLRAKPIAAVVKK